MKCQVALIGLIGILEQIHSIYTSRDQAVSILSAIDKGLAVDRALNRYRAEIVPEFRNFDHLAEDINTTPTTQEEVGRAYLNFHVCMVYHNVRLLAFLPLLSYAAWKDVQDTGEGPAPDQCLALAEKCVESAKAIVSIINRLQPGQLANVAFRINVRFSVSNSTPRASRT